MIKNNFTAYLSWIFCAFAFSACDPLGSPTVGSPDFHPLLEGSFSLSELTMSPAIVAPGQVVTVQLTVYDDTGVQVSTGGREVAFQFTSHLSEGALTPVTDNGNGSYTSTFIALTPGTVSTSATLDGIPITSTLPTVLVNGGVPYQLTYSANPAVYSQGSAIVNDVPSVLGSVPTSYSITPALPTGLSLSTSTGIISGTPSVSAALTSYVVTAANSTGSTTANLTLTVVAPPTVSLASFTGGQVVAGASSQNISWTAVSTDFGATPIGLYYSSDGGATWTAIASAIANSSPYSWTVPSLNNSTMRLKVTATDQIGNAMSAFSSSNFTIDSTAPAVNLTSFTGGQVVAGGSTQNITWTATDTNMATTPVSISYSTNSGSTWTSIVSSIANSGSYSWTVPSLNNQNCEIQIQVVDQAGNASTATSASTFAIDSTAPTISLGTPISAQIVQGNANFNITWSASDTNFGTTPIEVDYSSNSGSTWTALTTGVANTGSYTWAVPAVNSTTYRVRVIATDAAGHSTTAASAANFSVSYLPFTTSVVASNFVPTAESTTSTTYVDLATVDGVSFTLASAATLTIDYMADCTYTSGSGYDGPQNEVMVDGVLQTGSTNAGVTAVSYSLSTYSQWSQSFASGAHTIKVQHLTTGGHTLTWSSRLLTVTQTSAASGATTSMISTNQGQGSTTPADLTTHDTVSVTVDHSTPVMIKYIANMGFSSAASNSSSYVILDGNTLSSVIQTIAYDGNEASVVTIPATLSAGAHTIDVQHAESAGATNWQNRLLWVEAADVNMIGTNEVTTTESTSSSSEVDLTTPDSVTVNLPSASNVIIKFQSYVYVTGSAGLGGNVLNIINIDGTDNASSANYQATANTNYQHSAAELKVNLASGSHVIKVRHAVLIGGTASWSNRNLSVMLSP